MSIFDWGKEIKTLVEKNAVLHHKVDTFEKNQEKLDLLVRQAIEKLNDKIDDLKEENYLLKANIKSLQDYLDNTIKDAIYRSTKDLLSERSENHNN